MLEAVILLNVQRKKEFQYETKEGEIMIWTNDFEEDILYLPAKRYQFNKLYIVTGFTDCEMIAQHLIRLHDRQNNKENKRAYPSHIEINMILGMYKRNGITLKKHEKIKETLRQINRIAPQRIQTNCYYIYRNQEVHSKLYIWTNDKHSNGIAFMGAANYSINAFRVRREILTKCDWQEAMAYYDSVFEDTISCFNEEVFDKLKFKENIVVQNDDLSLFNYENLTYEQLKQRKPIDQLTISWLTSNGDVGKSSGPNWGYRGKKGYHRNLNEAYIPYNKARQKPGFFPDRKQPDDLNCPLFKVVTDDGEVFFMRMAQENNKGIHTATSNSLLGGWLRRKLGLKPGSFVTLEDFQRYGRTDVTFIKYADDVFIMEF